MKPEGMLWYCVGDGTSPEMHIKLAARYFKDKYGAAPGKCWVPPGFTDEEEVDGITIVELDTALNNHLLVGPLDKQ